MAAVFLLLSGLVYFVLQRRDELLDTILTPQDSDEEQEKQFFTLQDLQAPEPEPTETNEQAAQPEDNMQWPELPPDVR